MYTFYSYLVGAIVTNGICEMVVIFQMLVNVASRASGDFVLFLASTEKTGDLKLAITQRVLTCPSI